MIRRAQRTEAETLAALHRSSILSACSAVYSEQQIAAWLAVINPGAYLALMDHAEVLVAGDYAPVGVGVCAPDRGQINAAYVAPSMMRRGVGRELMRAMEGLLLAVGAREARLNATLNAVAFYRSLGYGDETPTLNRLPSGIDLPCVAMRKSLMEAWSSSDPLIA